MSGSERRLTEGLPAAERAALLATSLRQDARSAGRHLVVNVLAGSGLTPRVLRYALYRAMGIRTASPNLFSGTQYWGNAPVTIGANTFVNHDCYLERNAPIDIGRDCHLAMQVMVLTTTHPMAEDGSFAVQAARLPVVVEDGCWIGARATLLPGVRVGQGCVVAAGAVVTSDCRPHGLYAGVPARRVRDLAAVVGSAGDAAGQDRSEVTTT